jgi:hypothetical protein
VTVGLEISVTGVAWHISDDSPDTLFIGVCFLVRCLTGCCCGLRLIGAPYNSFAGAHSFTACIGALVAKRGS